MGKPANNEERTEVPGCLFCGEQVLTGSIACAVRRHICLESHEALDMGLELVQPRSGSGSSTFNHGLGHPVKPFLDCICRHHLHSLDNGVVCRALLCGHKPLFALVKDGATAVQVSLGLLDPDLERLLFQRECRLSLHQLRHIRTGFLLGTLGGLQRLLCLVAGRVRVA